MKLTLSVLPKNTFDVHAVVTDYSPDNYFYERVNHIRAQVGLVIIVVDGSGKPNIVDMLKNLFLSNPCAIVNALPDNIGIATELNVGMSIAKKGMWSCPY